MTENDLVMADEEGDLHIPHYVQLFGGLVFLESVKGFEKRLKKALAATAEDMMTADPRRSGPTRTCTTPRGSSRRAATTASRWWSTACSWA